MSNQYRDRVLALAGVFQAAHLVQQLAHHGNADRTALAASIKSVLDVDSKTTGDVYGGARGVSLGLQVLCGKPSARPHGGGTEMMRYVISVIQLERRLAQNTAMLAAVREGLRSVTEQMQLIAPDGGSDDEVHPSLATKLAELYGMTLTTLTPRIMVSGEQGHLANRVIADKVRAVLFAGTRSAYLWRQLGGQRWQLVLGKSSIAREALRILEQVDDDAAGPDADDGSSRAH